MASKILFLGINFRDWVAETLYHEQHAISKEMPSSVFYGPGYKYNTNYIPDIISESFGSSQPDAIFCYIDERRLLGEPMAQAVLERYNIPQHLHVFPKGLKESKLPKFAWINDFWHCSKEEWDEILLGNNFDFAFSTYSYPFVKQETFESFFSEKVRDRVRFIPWPRSMNTEIFKDYELPKIYDVTLLGARYPDFYPLRELMHQTFSASKDINYFSQDHPGYTFHDGKQSLTSVRYAQVINQSKIFASCTGRYNIPFIKLYEVMASRTTLVCDAPSGAEYLGLQPYETYVPVTKESFHSQVRELLANPKQIESISNAAYKLFNTHHTTKIRAAEFSKTVAALLAGKEEDTWMKIFTNKKTKTNMTTIIQKRDYSKPVCTRHILDFGLSFNKQQWDLWLKFAVNHRYSETPPVVTEYPEIVILRGILLQQLASTYKAKYMAEVGTARGFQSQLWAQYLLEQGSQEGRVFTCDIDGMDDRIYKTPLTGDKVFTRRELWQESLASHFIEFSHGDSSTLPAKISNLLDLIYIDGAHDYEPVWEDFRNIKDFLKPNSIIVFDDCDERFPGVQKAVAEIANELQEEYEIIEFTPHQYKIAIMHFGASEQSRIIKNSSDPISQPEPADKSALYFHWYKKLCVPESLARAQNEPLNWDGKPLLWDAAHEIYAFHEFAGRTVSPTALIELSNRRYELLEELWKGVDPTSKKSLDDFYLRSAQVLPWGHGIFIADHNLEERQTNWLKRLSILKMLRERGCKSVLDFGAGGGHTTTLAKVVGFERVVHHEFSIFHPFVQWRVERLSDNPNCRFEFSDAQYPLVIKEPVDAIICSDVAEHVFDPEAMLEQINGALKPGGLLVWVSMFEQNISCHINPQYRGHEEELLNRYGFHRLGDLPASYQGYTGLYEVQKPVQSPALTSQFSDNPNLFTDESQVYLASADRFDRTQFNQIALANAEYTEIDTYASVIGGFSGLNYLLNCQPKKICFFDVNKSVVDYAKLVVDLILQSKNHKDFISNVFGRDLNAFFEKSGYPELTIENQDQYLAQPISGEIVKKILSALSPDSAKLYERYISPHHLNLVLDGKRNCRRLLPCWPIDQKVPVGGGEDCGYDEFGKLVPNTNAFFYGCGWLANAATFSMLKETFKRVTPNFRSFDLLRDDISCLLNTGELNFIHISNVDDWFPQQMANQMQSWKDSVTAVNGTLVVITSHNGFKTFQPDPHHYAFMALKPHVYGQIVEVTHKIPWGFNEFERTNVITSDYLAGNYPGDTTILHILVGEGVDLETLKRCLAKAIMQSQKVIIMEHNADSADWRTVQTGRFLSPLSLRTMIDETLGVQKADVTFENIRGENDSRRNMMFTVTLKR